MRGEFDDVAGIGVLDRVLEQRVERVPQGFRVSEHSPGEVDVEPPRAGCDLRPADEEVGEERLDIDLLEAESLLLGLREQQQALDDPLHPSELVECNLELGRVGLLAPQQLEMATRDRDRCPQLVRGVVEEPLLPLEQRGAHLGDALNLCERRLPALRVPDHGEEHRRHERHLEQLTPELDAGERVGHDARARREDHHGKDGPHRSRRPDADAVDEREGDPDEVERDRLPARPGDHRHEIRNREGRPRSLERITP